MGLILPGLVLLPALAWAQTPLASTELQILGVRLTVLPAAQTVPRNQVTGLATALVDPANPSATVSDPSVGSLIVRGELRGPGLSAPLALQGAAGQVLAIPPLLTVGSYVIDTLRLEDTSGSFTLAADPAVATINVVDKIIVTSVASRPLSLDEIHERGIVVDRSNFSAFEFTFGLATESMQVPISFDVAFPQDKDIAAEEGGLTLPLVIPSLAAR
jgi:hypothetical protein